MKEFKLTLSSLGLLVSQLTSLLRDSDKEYRITVKEWRESRSLSQNALIHVCFTDISEYLIKKGRKDCSVGWVKEMLKYKFLGFESFDFVDVVTGEVIRRDVLRQTSRLDVGDMADFITNILAWSLDIGLLIKIPVTSDYYKLIQNQSK